MEKPKGTYKCLICKCIFDGKELCKDPQYFENFTCGNLGCDANVQKISDMPKAEYLKQIEKN